VAGQIFTARAAAQNRCNGIRFPAKFKRRFGVSLEKAEWQWRTEILLLEVLNARLKSSIYS